jgi:hypothetical protein
MFFFGENLHLDYLSNAPIVSVIHPSGNGKPIISNAIIGYAPDVEE